MTIQDMNEHVEKLALNMNVTILRNVGEFKSYTLTPTIGIKNERIESEQDYASALHELGHQANKHSKVFFQTKIEVVKEELEAWRWALQNAKSFTRMMLRHMLICLASYIMSKGLPLELKLNFITYTSNALKG